MKIRFSGKVLYANGAPVPNVEVHIYDQDSPGKQDDDLTIIPGLSDQRGRFTLTYEPTRFLDYHVMDPAGTPSQPFNLPSAGLKLPDLGDFYLPYLRFNYTFNGQLRRYTTPLGIFRKEYRLPEKTPIQFTPSSDGFKFINQFTGYFLPFTPPAFMGSRKVRSTYGLCGGMCGAAYDFALAGKDIPGSMKTPRQGTRLQRYLFQRQMDSWGGIGQEVIKVAQWTCLPDDTLLGTQARTAAEFPTIQKKLEDQNLVILAMIYEHASTISALSRVIFKNHQVLAYACQEDASGEILINVYDPNLPLRDDVVIRCMPMVIGEVSTSSGAQPVVGIKSTQLLGSTHFRDVRGFFAMTYTPVKPPKGL